MISTPFCASKIAEFLIQINAIVLKPNDPFTWASGWKSPIYCDNRKILSYPSTRTYVRQELTEAINTNFGKPDVIAGVATGGIAIGALVAQEMNLPFVYVRSEAKKHGMANTIEGKIEEGQRVVVVEDLISTGGSSLKAVKDLRSAGCDVMGMVAIFSYDFDVAKENFEKNKCKLFTLSDYPHLLKKAVEINSISEKSIESLEKWRDNPSEWKL